MATTSPQGTDPIELVRLPAQAASFDGFRAWARSDDFPAHGRFTFIDEGVLIDMSPEDLETHNLVKTEVVRVLAGLNRELQLGILCSDRMLMTNEAAGIATEPDAMLVTRAALRAGRAEFVTRPGQRHRSRELRGAPSWVLEVVSRSSIQKDKKLLRDAYHRAGVEEYWLIDALGEAIDFQILVTQEHSFVAQPIEDDGIASPLFGQRFALQRQEDEQGFWQYTLHARPL